MGVMGRRGPLLPQCTSPLQVRTIKRLNEVLFEADLDLSLGGVCMGGGSIGLSEEGEEVDPVRQLSLQALLPMFQTSLPKRVWAP